MAARSPKEAAFATCTQQVDSPPGNEVTTALSSRHLDEADKKLEAMGYKPVVLQFFCYAFQVSRH